MILSGQAIKRGIENGVLNIEPLDFEQVDVAHVDLRLGSVANQVEDFTLPPKAFTLGKTQEKVTLPLTICGFVEGRASLAKAGVSIEQSSKFIEPGSDNKITLEIFNASDRPVKLRIGQKIAKIMFMKVDDNI